MQNKDYALNHKKIDDLISLKWYYYEEGYRINGDPRWPDDAEYQNYRDRYIALRDMIDYVVQWKWPADDDDSSPITYHPEMDVDNKD